MWVADDEDDKIYAYDLASKARVAARDFNTLATAGNNDPLGVWSDGTTMWVVDAADRKLYAYDLASKARVAARDFETLQAADMRAPQGAWSDGDTMWVAETRGHNYAWLFAYNMPEDTANVEPTRSVADPPAFDRDTGREFGFSLDSAGNRAPVGIWSDGATMWVADWEDDKLYAYHTGSRAWEPSRDFDTLRAAGNNDPVGVWSDGATMWVADWDDDKIYAYDLASKARITAKEFDGLKAAGNEDPVGVGGSVGPDAHWVIVAGGPQGIEVP